MGYANHLKNTEFVYTPLIYEGDGMNFNINELKAYNPTKVVNERDEYLEVCRRWDSMLGFNGLTTEDVDRGSVTKLTHPGDPPQYMSEELKACFNGEGKIKIKNNFTLPKPIKTDYIDVAVHIRRGDVSTAEWAADRWLGDEYYLTIINDIKSVLGDRCKITIYTQRGRYIDHFNQELFSDYNIKYDDETLDNEVWLELVHSDILVMGLSSYSYSASLLSDGICVYPPKQMGLCGPKICDTWVTPDNLKNTLKNL